jgi:hypothetical protein
LRIEYRRDAQRKRKEEKKREGRKDAPDGKLGEGALGAGPDDVVRLGGDCKTDTTVSKPRLREYKKGEKRGERKFQ